ncbi:MAG: ABC transporter permease [Anaerolineae bacterium]|nr:ABC transporter permease [Anaerolineae bacterium]
MQSTQTLLTTALPALQPLSKSGFIAQVRAFAAVMWREWFHFVRYPTWIIAFIIWPILFPAVYILGAFSLAGPTGAGIDVFLKTAGTTNFLGYIVVGTTVWMWINTMLWNVGFALREEMMRGTLESNWMSPTSRFYFLIGTGPVHAATMVMFLICTIVEFKLIFNLDFNANLLSLLVVIITALPALYGMGFTFASVVISARESQNFVFLIRGIVMIFCGITYPLSVMPGWMQSIANWIPPTVMIRVGRAAALNHATIPELAPDLFLLLLHGAFWMLFGYLAFVMIERRARRKGSLGQY